ncbi:MAG: hypothetical protein ABSG48_06710 [Geobacteraceae bacterium]
MTSIISGISSHGVDLLAHTATAPKETTAKPRLPDAKNTGIQPEGDSVVLSTSAKSRQMKEQDESLNGIDDQSGVDDNTVQGYPASVKTPTSTQVRQMKEQGETAVEIADRLNVDVKTVESYLGAVRPPTANQAKQLEQQGASVVEIADRLNLDVKTVNLYLGIAPLSAESTAGNEFDG